MTKIDFQKAGRASMLFSALTALTITLAAAHPDTHADKTPAQAQGAARADITTAVGTVNAFHAALVNGDTAAALALLSEDVIIFESGNVESSRAEYANHHLKADAAFSAAVKRTLVTRSQGEKGDSAWVLSVETVSGTYRNRVTNSRSIETMMLKRIDGQWQIVHIHWSSADLRPVNS